MLCGVIGTKYKDFSFNITKPVVLSKSIRGHFHVNGPRKKVNVAKWIFLNEMLKIIKKNDFGRFLNNFCSFGVFLAHNKKSTKNTVLKK